MDDILGIQMIAQDCIRKEKEMRLLVFLTAVIMAITTLLFATGLVEIEIM